MRIDRMLSITILLLNRRSITARELAQRFEVSVRTIYRDIEALNRAGIPIISYQGVGGGYCIMENYRVSRQLLTLNDMGIILSALKGINTTLEDRGIDSAIDKINSLIPIEKEHEIEKRLDQVVFDVLPWGYSEEHRVKLRDFQQAIISHTLVSIAYQSMKGEKLIRLVEPMTILFKGNAWYVFAFCRTRNDFRLFKLSRIRSLTILKEHFKRRQGSYRDYQKWDTSNMKTVDLVLKFSSRVLTMVEEFFDPDTITREQNGDLIVRVTFPEDRWVYGLILSYGSYVEVIKPIYMREIIRAETFKMHTKYTSPNKK